MENERIVDYIEKIHISLLYLFVNEDNGRCDDSHGNLCSDMHQGEERG